MEELSREQCARLLRHRQLDHLSEETLQALHGAFSPDEARALSDAFVGELVRAVREPLGLADRQTAERWLDRIDGYFEAVRQPRGAELSAAAFLRQLGREREDNVEGHFRVELRFMSVLNINAAALRRVRLRT